MNNQARMPMGDGSSPFLLVLDGQHERVYAGRSPLWKQAAPVGSFAARMLSARLLEVRTPGERRKVRRASRGLDRDSAAILLRVLRHELAGRPEIPQRLSAYLALPTQEELAVAREALQDLVAGLNTQAKRRLLNLSQAGREVVERAFREWQERAAAVAAELVSLRRLLLRGLDKGGTGLFLEWGRTRGLNGSGVIPGAPGEVVFEAPNVLTLVWLSAAYGLSWGLLKRCRGCGEPFTTAPGAAKTRSTCLRCEKRRVRRQDTLWDVAQRVRLALYRRAKRYPERAGECEAARRELEAMLRDAQVRGVAPDTFASLCRQRFGIRHYGRTSPGNLLAISGGGEMSHGRREIAGTGVNG